MDALNGLLAVVSPFTIFLIFGGVVIGIIFGALPGLTAATAVAVFLPATFGMNPTNGIVLLIGLYIGGISGGLVSAILLKIPGTPSSIATTFDGAPMAARGEAGKALGVGIFSSFLGTIFSLIILIFLSPIIANFALEFGPWEYFAIGVFSLSLISSLISSSVIKGLISAVIGLVLSMIGRSAVDAAPRLTFGFRAMQSGLDLLPVLIGLFAVPEFLKSCENHDLESIKAIKFQIKGFGFSFKEYFSQWINLLRSALIGIGIGILPGIGGSTSNIIAYLAARNQSKYPEKFGTGIIDGVIASETSNNATIGGAMIPLLTLGIPGDGVTALLLGGLLLHGIAPGPLLFVTQKPLVYSIFGAMAIGSIIMLVIMYIGIHPLAKILEIPKHILLPMIMVICVVGSYTVNNRLFDVITLLVIGIMSYGLEKLEFPLTPIVMGFVLGPIVELNLRRGLMANQNSMASIVKSPIAMIFLSIAVLSIIYSFMKNRIKLNRKNSG